MSGSGQVPRTSTWKTQSTQADNLTPQLYCLIENLPLVVCVLAKI